MSHILKRQRARWAVRGDAGDSRLSRTVVCGLSVVVLQTALLERTPFDTSPVEDAQALAGPDSEDQRPAAAPAPRRSQLAMGDPPFPAGPLVSVEPQPEIGAPIEPVTSAAADAARRIAIRLLAAHPLRGPPRLPA
jgi:hypothetical protein